ncbi:glycoside hydrolase family 113 [Neolewinella agarilytica]|uniref:glycoside hydrolase family 113 n=1 Tax=Neolewinella agarilytica TaxID=478744 RepID=UPI002357310E|nr:hypothetical protein [Neolewinella agarilytica]
MSKPVPEAEPEPNRRQLTRQAMRASVWRFVYCLQDPAESSDLKAFLEDVASKQPFGKRIEVYGCGELSADTLGSGPIILFGDRIPEGGEELPIQRGGDGWQFDQRLGFAYDDVFLLPYYTNPWSDKSTVSGLYLSANTASLIKRLNTEFDDNWGRLFRPSWAYEIHRANGDRILGSFADTTWAFDPAQEMTMASPEDPVYQEGQLTVFAYDGMVKKEELTRSVRALKTVQALLDTITGQQSDWFPEVRFYPNLERIGLRTGSMAPVQYASDKKVLHLVPCFMSEADILTSFTSWQPFVEHIAGGSLTGENLSLLTSALQASADRYAPESFLKDQRNTALQFLLTGEQVSRQNLSKENGSGFIEEATARALTLGHKFDSPAAAYRAILRTKNKALPAELLAEYDLRDFPISAPESRPMPTAPLSGMTFAHQGYRVHNGYGGEKIKPSLDSLAELNVNALAIVPYTFQRDPNKVGDLPIGDSAGGENDWATACSIREAHSRGWFTMLKPQIWVGRGSWPGDIEFETEEEWDDFFERYTYWILHYALLAEKEKVGALCIGTELRYTTLKHPERWREVIRKVRMVYGGQVTYAANWGDEFEGFTFWDELDAIGLNSYYPISDSDTPTDEELLTGARRWMKLAQAVSQKTGKPLWLTETGFRSVSTPWKNPHAEAGDRAPDQRAQARCYRALVTAADETPELKAIFIWKWPSYLGADEGSRSPGRNFSPGGKEAAEVLAGFYGGWN